MESSTAFQAGAPAPVPSPSVATAFRKPRPSLLRALDFVASLRVTVVLFALAFILVFYGTWAQVNRGIWEVVRDYFRNDLIVWIPVRVLTCFWLRQDRPINEFCLPYPGGFLIGWLLFINLLAAHIVRFKLSWKRSGIIILHAGIIIMMLGEYFTGKFAVEGVMSIGVGETVNFVQDNRACELAIVDATDSKRTEDDVVAIYQHALKTRRFSNAELPFELEVKEFMANSELEDLQPGHEPQATHGRGKALIAARLPESSGVDPTQRVDTPSVVVSLRTKDTGEDLGTYLLSYWLARGEKVKLGDKVYEISLRPKRSYRDYTVHLVKAEQKHHPNQPKMPKDFSSYILLDDPAHGVHNMEVRIFMNSPLRYRGEAFFQANMSEDSSSTGLQVVRNEVWSLPVWTLPYISCIVVALGMLIHFGIKLIGFLEVQLRAIR